MALRSLLEWKHNDTWIKSGGIYSFNYRPYQNDATPLCVALNTIIGTHPNTGNTWNLTQAINLHYIPRKDRKVFASDWFTAWEYSNSIEFTWREVTKHFPYLKFGIRRYLIKPNYYIWNLKEIKKENYEETIVGSIWKDYSYEIKRKMLAYLRKKGKI